MTAGASRRVPAAVPAIASPSPVSEPRMRNSRTYAVVATPVSPMRTTWRGIDGDRGDDRGGQAEQADDGDGPDPQPDDDGQPGESERDDDEGEQAHGGGSGWVSEP